MKTQLEKYRKIIYGLKKIANFLFKWEGILLIQKKLN